MQKPFPQPSINFRTQTLTSLPVHPATTTSTMKTILSSCFKSTKSIRYTLSILAASAALSCQGFAAEVVADFTGGDSDAVVDGWYGKPGEGWVDKWTRSYNGGSGKSTFSTATKDDDPLTPSGGNYLRSSLTQVDGTATWSSVVARQYDNATIDYTQNHTVSFEFRLDSPTNGLNNLVLFDGTSANRDATAAAPTWYIYWSQTHSDFTLYDGKTSQRSGVDLVTGDVYRFTIDIAPSLSTYSLVIENLTTEVASEFEGLSFYTNTNSVGGYLNFGGKVSTTIDSKFTFSLDSVHVIPEPSSLSLLGSVAGVIWLLSRRRRRGSLGKV